MGIKLAKGLEAEARKALESAVSGRKFTYDESLYEVTSGGSDNGTFFGSFEKDGAQYSVYRLPPT